MCVRCPAACMIYVCRRPIRDSFYVADEKKGWAMASRPNDGQFATGWKHWEHWERGDINKYREGARLIEWRETPGCIVA
ncbi:hypothetical protein I7I48_09857 [Histoplasma ohiense]|nr:hypothetical protein I7I48_09857 [Histoplasma ohiense (nom. inval.)]